MYWEQPNSFAFFDDNNLVLGNGDPVGERLAKLATEIQLSADDVAVWVPYTPPQAQADWSNEAAGGCWSGFIRRSVRIGRWHGLC
jgi:hypothetical protein